MIRIRRFLIGLPAALLLSCERAPPPASHAALPTVERPTLRLPTAKSADGNFFVPRNVVVERGGIPGVFVLSDGLARFHMVRLGKIADNRVQIISGLTPGEILIQGDLSSIHDGTPIRQTK